MVKIRLMRIGGRQRPFYRVVAVDERAKRTGGYVELLGTYNPLTEPKEIKLKQDRIDHWIKQGAQMSDGFLRIIGKAPQRPPRKPKKQKGESVKGEAVKPAEETKAEETKTEATAQANTSEESPPDLPAGEAGAVPPSEVSTTETPAETPQPEAGQPLAEKVVEEKKDEGSA